MAIITASEARQYIPGITGTAQDTDIDKLIARAGAAIAAFLGFPTVDGAEDPTVEQATYTEFYDGSPTETLTLGIFPVISVTSVHDDPDRVYGADTLVATNDYEIDKRAGKLILTPTAALNGWTRRRRAQKVVFVAGWASGTIDRRIVETCIEEVAVRWRRRPSTGLTSVSGGKGSASVRDPSALLPESEERLSALRLPRALL
jgi:hypothetical protein